MRLTRIRRVSLLLLAGLAVCAGAAWAPSAPVGLADPVGPGTAGPGPIPTATGAPPVLTSGGPKVMIIPEENKARDSVIGSPDAPYLNQLAAAYGNTTNMVANYPVSCPSLAAYIIFTSGSQQGICDDASPANHQLTSDNIFRQLAVARKEWRQYAESMTANCQRTDGTTGGFLVRHTPPPYYTSEINRCPLWDVPMGTPAHGALHEDLASGLPDLSIVTPNACHDMHGAANCANNLVRAGDDWLASWLPQIVASDDFQSDRLVVVITWDEGSNVTNLIPTLVVARRIHAVTSGAAYTHCSTLRTAEELLRLPLLGCARTAVSFRPAFHL